jgi:hypothetical protein
LPGASITRADLTKQIFNGKNRNRKPYDIEIAIHPILESVLSMHKVTALTSLVTRVRQAILDQGPREKDLGLVSPGRPSASDGVFRPQRPCQ